MKEYENLDELDQSILHILSLYEHLNLLRLWYEIGEVGTFGPVRKQEILDRLSSLVNKGLVKCIDLGNGEMRWALIKKPE
jgi:hypothetical protein